MKKLMLIAAVVGWLPVLSQAKTFDMKSFEGQVDQVTESFDFLKLRTGYVIGTDPNVGKPSKPIEWVALEGGRFVMGTDNGYGDEQPIHEVTIKNFSMTKTEVTVEQYAECVIKKQCAAPDNSGDYCNWGKADRKNHPVNCIDWNQANQYAKFISLKEVVAVRLPSEAEWEFAATSRGKNQKYPWGNDEPTCDRTVMNANGNYGCGTGRTMPVCSKTAGNTEQGLCDMSGNVWEWVQDKYVRSYADAPNDGSAYEKTGSRRVVRGGSFDGIDARYLRADNRNCGAPGGRLDFVGFRLAR